MRFLPCLFLAAAAAACQPATAPTGSAPTTSAEEPSVAFDGIHPDEAITFTGTEPFWGGTIDKGTANYSTPENSAGESFAVTRFAGNNGVSFSGTMSAGKWDMMITPGACSDGMSDRSYPFAVTLAVGTEQRQGCAWTERQGFTGPSNP